MLITLITDDRDEAKDEEDKPAPVRQARAGRSPPDGRERSLDAPASMDIRSFVETGPDTGLHDCAETKERLNADVLHL